MSRNVVLALVAGLLGGMITRYTAPPTAFAQNPAPATKEIRAQSFTLVDQSDQTVGTFSAEIAAAPAQGAHRNSSMRIILRDSSGRVIWSAGGTGIQPLTTQLYSK